MLFGPAFYRRIEKLKNWQQQIFATAIAQRMLPNYTALYMEDRQTAQNYRLLADAIGQLWGYSMGASAVQDWYPLRKSIRRLVRQQKQDSVFGVAVANSAVKAVLAAIDSILEHKGDEAMRASDLSVKILISFLENQEGRRFSDEEIVENEVVQNELDFQMAVAQKLSSRRSAQVLEEILALALNDGYSNIGIQAPEADDPESSGTRADADEDEDEDEKSARSGTISVVAVHGARKKPEFEPGAESAADGKDQPDNIDDIHDKAEAAPETADEANKAGAETEVSQSAPETETSKSGSADESGRSGPEDESGKTGSAGGPGDSETEGLAKKPGVLSLKRTRRDNGADAGGGTGKSNSHERKEERGHGRAEGTTADAGRNGRSGKGGRSSRRQTAGGEGGSGNPRGGDRTAAGRGQRGTFKGRGEGRRSQSRGERGPGKGRSEGGRSQSRTGRRSGDA
ncbi:MAG: DUF416 family protein [Succinivibrionaceae bacterium]|nr:DUF416 family protein [Succinivibrionaceae bacterium]